MQMRIDQINPRSYVDGPGERVVLFMQGCPLACKGCQNRHLWDAQGGTAYLVEDIAERLLAELTVAGHNNLTISGGEPFAQPRALAKLLRLLRDRNPDLHVILYTGYTYEQVVGYQPGGPDHNIEDLMFPVIAALDKVDILVDGPFIAELDDPFISYRGSRNQRMVNVRYSFESGGAWVIEDLDSAEIAIADNGSVFLPVGLSSDFAEVGEVENTRRCGQTR